MCGSKFSSHILIRGILALVLVAGAAKAQNQNYTFDNGTVQSWTLVGPFDENGKGPFTPTRISPLSWDDLTNYPGNPGTDSSGDRRGSLNFSILDGTGINNPGATYWTMEFRSPDLSSLVLWQRNTGFFVEMYDGIGLKDSTIIASLVVFVYDSSDGSTKKFSSPSPRPLLRRTWNALTFDWSAESGFPARYRIVQVRVLVTGYMALVYYGDFHLDNATVLGLSAPPYPPQLIFPSNGSTGVSTAPTFSWNTSPGAATYRLQISTDSVFAKVFFDSSGIQELFMAGPALGAGQRFFWRVNALNPITGSGTYSPPWSFTTSTSLPLAPILLAPPNGSTDVQINPVLQWNPAPGAASYHLQVSTSVGFINNFFDQVGITATSQQISGLARSTTYYWRLNATNGQGQSGPYSGAWILTTVPPPPSPPVLISPLSGSTGTSRTPTLTWNAVSGATSYRLQVAPDTGFTPLTLDSSGITGTSRTITGLSASTTYYWRVSATNAGGSGAFSTPWRFVTVPLPPPPPVLASPPNGATGLPTNVTISWNATSGAISYRLQIAPDSGFASLTYDSSGITTTSRAIGGLTANTTYYWRVSASNAGGSGSFSTSWRFTTQIALPATPALLSPLNGSSDISLNPVLGWSATAGATSYRLQVSQDSLFQTTAFDDSTITTTSRQVGQLSYGTLFHWRVHAKNLAGASGYSSPWRFTTVQATPTLSVPTSSVSFGTVTIGKSKADSLVVGNTGAAVLIVSKVSLSGSNAGYFNADTSVFSLNPAEYRTLQVRFSPILAGSFICTLSVTTNGGNATITLSGNGQDLPFTLSPAYRTPSSGDTLGVAFAVPPAFQLINSVLYYRNGGERTYHTSSLHQAGGNILAVIPSSAVNIRGIEYYAVITNGIDTLTFPKSLLTDPANNPAAIRVPVETEVAPVVLSKRQYTMISVPVELNDPQIRSVLADDFGEYNPRFWRILRWGTSGYEEVPNLTSSFVPGNAFWIVTFDKPGFDVDQGRSVNSLTPYTLTLQPGWNQIADPFAFPVAWDSIGGKGKIPPPYSFDGTEFQPGVRVLRPWEGYFVWSDSSVPLALSVQPREAATPALKAVSFLPDHISFQLQLSATMTGTTMRDLHTYLGFIDRSVNANSLSSLRKPPAIGDYVRASFREHGQEYMTQFVPVPDSGRCWDLVIGSSVTDGVVHIVLTQNGSLPEGFSVFLLDVDRGTGLTRGTKEFDVMLGEGGSRRRFRIVVGTAAYAERNAEDIPLGPRQFALDQNYPNPFNPTTTIRYSLGARSDVVLEVFNMLGERVRVLVNDQESAGLHTKAWDGTSDSGVPAASGVYYARLRAGSFVAARKLLLVR